MEKYSINRKWFILFGKLDKSLSSSASVLLSHVGLITAGGHLILIRTAIQLVLIAKEIKVDTGQRKGSCLIMRSTITA